MESKLILGDCLEEMKKIPDKSIDLVLTDPPYGLNIEYKSYIDTNENLRNLVNNFIPEALRIGKIVVSFCGVQNIWIYPQADWIMSYSWNTTANYGLFGYNQWQPILLYGKDIKGFGSVNGVLKSDSLKFSGGFRRKKGIEHPCPKPDNVIEMLIQRFSNEGQTILDCFMGSGTTGVACKKLNRNFIGIELDKEYFEIAKKRIEETNG